MSTTNDTGRYDNHITGRPFLGQPFEHSAWAEPRHIQLLERIAIALEKLVEDK